MDQPNPIKVLWGIWRVQKGTRRPNPSGDGVFDPSGLVRPLRALSAGGLPGLAEARDDLQSFIRDAEATDPDAMGRNEALAFWINVYNAGAMDLALDAQESGASSVLRVPGAFRKSLLEIDGEALSLDAIEHGKIRRFADPRIHGALVCGSLSCPTLRADPYRGTDLNEELDDQMRNFLGGGGAQEDGDVLMLSRIFSWYGRDFVSPSKMPTFVPVSTRRVVRAISEWLPADTAYERVEFQAYDWSLACNVA